MFHRARYDILEYTGQILMTGQATSATAATTHTFNAMSLGDAQVGDYILIAISAVSSGVANRTIAGVTLDGQQATYKNNTYYSANSQSSAIFMIPATGNATGTVVVTFSVAANRCFVTLYRCRDIDPEPVDSFNAITPASMTGDLLIPSGGIAAATSGNSNSTAASTWVGLTKDPDIGLAGTPAQTQGVAYGQQFATEQNKLTTLCTWSPLSSPTIVGVSFGPKNYYPPASLTYLGKGQQTATQASFTFPAFNLGSYFSGRVIYIAVSATSSVARSLQSVFVGGKPAIIVTPFNAASTWCNYNIVSLATDTTADIVVNFSFNMIDCAIGVWVGNGYDADWVDAYTFVGTQTTILMSTLRCMSVGSCRSSSLTPSWSTGLITRDQTTRDAFGDITALGSSTGLITNAYYNMNNGGSSGAATFPRAAPITPTIELIGKQGNGVAGTPQTFNNFNYAGGNGLGTPSADRVIYAALISIQTNAHSITSLTLGGVAMTRITAPQSSGTAGAVFTLALPTGTSGDFIATFSRSVDRAELFVWVGRGYSADGYDSKWATNNAVLNLPAGGMAIGQAHDDQTLSPRWTSGLGHMDNVAAGGGNSNAAGRINTKAGSITLSAVFGQAYSCVHGASFPQLGMMPTGPNIASAVSYQSSSSVTSHAVTLPSSMAIGDMCIIISGAGSVTINTPAGWTSIGNTATSPANNVFYRIIDGTEGATVTVTTSAAGFPNFIAHRITGASKTIPPEFSQGGVVSSAGPGAPAITPSWGFAPILCIACVTRVVVGAPTAFPTNYTINPTNININTHTTASVGRQLNTDTEAPAYYTFAAAASSRGFMIAIRG